MRGPNTAEKHENKTDFLQEFDQRAHYNYLGPNNYNLKKKQFHQVQQHTDQYTNRLSSMSHENNTCWTKKSIASLWIQTDKTKLKP